MISFACTCGQKFDVPETQAGDSFQCPRCMRLVDVPQLSELHMIEEDGTFKLYEMEPPKSELAEKMKTFSFRGDQRQNVDEFLAAGVAPVDTRPDRSEHGPRYDPETGERIVPIDLQIDFVIDLPHTIPVAAPVLGYASAAPAANGPTAIGPKLHWWDVPWRLGSGVNLFAVMFVYLAHVAIHIALLVPVANLLLAPFMLFLVVLIMAHYCNTIEDFGVNGRDRVPVMFRNGSVSEDILHPLFNILIAGLISFGPFIAAIILAVWKPKLEMRFAELALFWGGVFFFPAAIFTATCSGALQNMTPLRIGSVIAAAPLRYTWAAIAFATAFVAYVMASQFFAFTPVLSLQASAGTRILPSVVAKSGLVYVLLFAAVYAMHLAAAWLGLIYQSHYERFKWILQRHEPVNARNDTAAQLAELRRKGDPRIRRGQRAAPAATTPPDAPKPVLPVRSIDS